MQVKELYEFLRELPAQAVVIPKVYGKDMDGITLEVFTLTPRIKRLGAIDIKFVKIEGGKNEFSL